MAMMVNLPGLTTEVRADSKERDAQAALERALWRFSFLCTGAYLLYVAQHLWERGLGHVFSENVLLTFLAYGFGFALLVLSVLRASLVRYRFLPFLALGFALLASFYIRVRLLYPGYSSDSLLHSHYAALVCLQGKNPYTQSMVPGYLMFGLNPNLATPHIDNAHETRLLYPAFNFLAFVPFVALGVQDIRFVVLLFHLLTLALVYRSVPRPLKPLALFPLFMDAVLIDSIAGITDIVWVFLLLLAAVLWRRRHLSPLFYGLACSFKPTPWGLAPYILIRLWLEGKDLPARERRWPVIRFAALAGGAFALVNLPFFLTASVEWANAVLNIASPSLVMWGSGLSALSQTGLLGLPPTFYFRASLLVLCTLLLNYYWHYDRLKYTLWIYAGLPMWFWSRALQNYFIFWTPLLLVSLGEWFREGRSTMLTVHDSGATLACGPTGPQRDGHGRVMTALSVALCVTTIAILAVYYGYGPGRYPLSARVQGAVVDEQAGHVVNELRVELVNGGPQAIEPHFWVKFWAWHPSHYDIIEGPTVLEPYRAADYVVRAYMRFDMVPATTSFRVLVHDIRDLDILTISPLFSADPGISVGLANADLKYWTRSQAGSTLYPYRWALRSETDEGDQVQVNRERVDGVSNSLAMEVYQDDDPEGEEWAEAALEQEFLFPQSALGVWVHPEFSLDESDRSESRSSVKRVRLYGVQIVDGRHRLTYLFTDAEQERQWDEKEATIANPAPLNKWSFHLLDVRQDYQRFGWNPPEGQRVRFRYLLAVAKSSPGWWRGHFGPVIQKREAIARELMRALPSLSP